MSEYLKALQNITKSAESLQKGEHNSVEIRQAATNLRQSVQPCIEELERTANRLKSLVQQCLADLEHAEDVWKSKSRITATEKQEVWTQIGELSGRHFRIYRLGNQCKRETIKKAKKYWEEKFEALISKWFIDSKGKTKIGIGWSEKDSFIKAINSELHSVFPLPKINLLINESLQLIYQEFLCINLESINYYTNLFDKRAKADSLNKIEGIWNLIEFEFYHSKNELYNNAKELNDTVRPTLEAWEKMWGDLSWEETAKFKDKIALKIEDIITAIFDKKIKLLTQAIEWAIAFCDDFLERQERYQQETLEQREAEKAWIEQQRQELALLHKNLEAIQNPFGG